MLVYDLQYRYQYSSRVVPSLGISDNAYLGNGVGIDQGISGSNPQEPSSIFWHPWLWNCELDHGPRHLDDCLFFLCLSCIFSDAVPSKRLACIQISIPRISQGRKISSSNARGILHIYIYIYPAFQFRRKWKGRSQIGLLIGLLQASSHQNWHEIRVSAFNCASGKVFAAFCWTSSVDMGIFFIKEVFHSGYVPKGNSDI